MKTAAKSDRCALRGLETGARAVIVRCHAALRHRADGGTLHKTALTRASRITPPTRNRETTGETRWSPRGHHSSHGRHARPARLRRGHAQADGHEARRGPEQVPGPQEARGAREEPAPRGKKPSSKKGQRKPPPPVGFYDRALATYPVATNAAQAGLMSFASALASQSLAGIPLDELDYEKPLHFGAVAALVVAPLSLVFFNFVENLSVPAKLLFDLVVGGPVLNVGFVAALGLLRGQSLESIVATVSSVDQFWVALVLASNKVWLPAKVFMYGFLPARYWGLWCAVVSFVWGIILAVIVV